MPLGMIGKYERLDVLGHGVSGIVYLAKDTLLNKQVALKEVDVQAGDLRRFLEEARVMDRLRHPNIVRVNNVDRIEGKVIIDMEYVRGQNLQEMLRQEGPQSLDRALDICAQVLDALDYAHHMQTVHRDIKPANILIGRDGQVKLVDFGLAEILATNAYAGGAGTYAYMAPEDFAEDDRSDHQSDIWAVGVTLFEMVTGQRPFNVMKVKDPFAWKRILETESPIPLAAYLPLDTPRLQEVQAVLDRALARDKRARYQTAGDFRDDLRKIRAAQPLSPEATRQRRGPVMDIFDSSVLGAIGSEKGRGKREEAADSSPTRNTRYPTSDTRPPTLREGRGKRETGETGSALENQKSKIENFLTPVERVVADVNPPAVQGKRRIAKLPLSRRDAAVHLRVEPGRIDFGSVRKGELSSVKITARVSGAEGDVEGRVTHASDWLTVHPPVFDRARQSITLTAHTDRAWETGEFYDTIQVTTNAGETEIPVRLMVMPARPRFFQVGAWYLPLFVLALLPAIAVAIGSGGAHHSAGFITAYTPGAALVSGVLALMLLLVSIAADIGLAERLACGVLIAIMCATLGLSTSQIGQAAHSAGNALVAERAIQRAFMAGGFMGGVVLLQLLHLRKWKLWACVIGVLGLGIGGMLLKILG